MNDNDFMDAVIKAIKNGDRAVSEIQAKRQGRVPDDVQKARYTHFKTNPDQLMQMAARHVPAAQVQSEAVKYMKTMERRYDGHKLRQPE